MSNIPESWALKGLPTPHSHPLSIDTGSTLKSFLARELELGSGTWTATDHGSLGACRQVYDMARGAKLTPILGIEGYFRDDNCPILKAADIDDVKGYNKYYHVTVHCLDEAAFSTVSRVLARAPVERHGSEYKSVWNWADMEEIGAANVTIGAGCLIGMVARHLLSSRPDLSRAYFDRLKGLTRPGNFYAEAFPHVCDRNWSQGYYLHLAGVPDPQKMWHGKKLKIEDVGEITISALAERVSKGNVPQELKLLAIKEGHKWTDGEPKLIARVENREDFIPNECTPAAPDGDVQAAANRYIISIANRNKVPVLISDDSHLATAGDKVLQDIRLAQSGSWRFHVAYERLTMAKSYETLHRTLGIDQAQFEAWAENNQAWADRFKGFEFTSKPELPAKFYPEDTLGHLRALLAKHSRVPDRPGYAERLESEIELLHNNGVIDLLPYFFLLEEACQEYADKGELTGPGRGSAAGLLLTYALGITHVDPIRYRLSVERFLTLDRVKSGALPDIDQDLPYRDLIDDPETGWLERRFSGHWAQIGTDMVIKARSAAKDVARARLGYVPTRVEEYTSQFVQPPQGIDDRSHIFGYTVDDVEVAGSITYDKALQDYAKDYPADWERVQQLLGLVRGRGRHAAGFAVTARPISETIPVTRIDKRPVTQFTAGGVEAQGAVKMDFLVITSLLDIAGCLEMLRKERGNAPESLEFDGRRVPRHQLCPTPDGQWADIWDLPNDDSVYRDVCTGDTESVFQFATPGARQWLTHFSAPSRDGRPAMRDVDGLAAFCALNRPGPLGAFVEDPETGDSWNMLVEYARRARGERRVGSSDTNDRLMAESHGVMCFQEQLQSLYQHMTGCSGSEAEDFRRLIAKKKMDKVMAKRQAFIEKATPKVGRGDAEKTWDTIVTWGQYGFNKSHSVAYSVISYACAYLKHYYPIEWWCSVLQNAKKEDVETKFWVHCGKHIAPPSILASGATYEVQAVDGVKKIRAPVTGLKGLGPTVAARLERLVAQKPTSMKEFLAMDHAIRVEGGKRVTNKAGKESLKLATSPLNRGIIYPLILVGAMDELFPPNTLTIEKWAEYEKALAEVTGAKRKPVPDSYLEMTPVDRWLWQRSLSSVVTSPITPFFRDFFRREETAARKRTFITVQGEEREVFSWRKYEEWNEHPNWPDGHKETIALVGYLVKTKPFQYGPNKSKHACELVIEGDGGRIDTVRWPDWGSDRVPDEFRKLKPGALVAITLFKNRREKPFKVVRLQEFFRSTQKKKEQDVSRDQQGAGGEESPGSENPENGQED